MALSRWTPFILSMLSIAPTLPAYAAGGASLGGEYVCASGCRLTDAAPSIEIEGQVAHCMNELGGTFSGKVLSPTSVYCFNKTGTLAQDGQSILWSNGSVWKRR